MFASVFAVHTDAGSGSASVDCEACNNMFVFSATRRFERCIRVVFVVLPSFSDFVYCNCCMDFCFPMVVFVVGVLMVTVWAVLLEIMVTYRV